MFHDLYVFFQSIAYIIEDSSPGETFCFFLGLMLPVAAILYCVFSRRKKPLLWVGNVAAIIVVAMGIVLLCEDIVLPFHDERRILFFSDSGGSAIWLMLSSAVSVLVSLITVKVCRKP